MEVGEEEEGAPVTICAADDTCESACAGRMGFLLCTSKHGA